VFVLGKPFQPCILFEEHTLNGAYPKTLDLVGQVTITLSYYNRTGCFEYITEDTKLKHSKLQQFTKIIKMEIIYKSN